VSDEVVIRRAGPRDDAMLAEVLVDSVEGGASVGFLLPLEHQRATAFWKAVNPTRDEYLLAV
jgi:hypothetical protein